MIYLQKSTNNKCKNIQMIHVHKNIFPENKWNIIKVFSLYPGKIISTMSHNYLDKTFALMQDNQQDICHYGTFSALKLKANNVNKY